jgi:hypothetical protein
VKTKILFLLPVLVLLFFVGCSQTLTISTESVKRTIFGSARDGIVIYNNSSIPVRIIGYEFEVVITALDDPSKLLTDTIPAGNAVRVGIREWFFENRGRSHYEFGVIPLAKRSDGLRMETERIRWSPTRYGYWRQGQDHRFYSIEDKYSRTGVLEGIKIKK